MASKVYTIVSNRNNSSVNYLFSSIKYYKQTINWSQDFSRYIEDPIPMTVSIKTYRRQSSFDDFLSHELYNLYKKMDYFLLKFIDFHSDIWECFINKTIVLF